MLLVDRLIYEKMRTAEIRTGVVRLSPMRTTDWTCYELWSIVPYTYVALITGTRFRQTYSYRELFQDVRVVNATFF